MRLAARLDLDQKVRVKQQRAFERLAILLDKVQVHAGTLDPGLFFKGARRTRVVQERGALRSARVPLEAVLCVHLLLEPKLFLALIDCGNAALPPLSQDAEASCKERKWRGFPRRWGRTRAANAPDFSSSGCHAAGNS